MKIHPLVTDTKTLAEHCARLAEADWICFDTEFMRESTYYPELCLIQLASPAEAFAVDPLAPDIDIQCVLDLMLDDSILKVVHAGGQDIEIIMNLTDRVPQPLFDTQIAAMALGMGDQVSYANLVSHFTGVHIDKGARFTDWARRPLSERQIEYAVGDVTYLAQMFPRMLDRLRRTGRGEWLDEEMGRMTDPANYRVDPDQMWHRIKLPNRKPEVLGRLKALGRWRETEAQSRNIPRGRIMKDETLADLAASPPASQADLGRVRGLSAGWTNNAIGQRLMTVLAEAPPLPVEEIPKRDNRPGLSSDSSLVADVLKLLLKIRCKEEGVAPKLVARNDELERLAGGERHGLSILEGWRRTLFGEDALALVEGRIGFSVVAGKLRLRTLAPDIPAAASLDDREAPLQAPGVAGEPIPHKAQPYPTEG